ncbi:beta-galactosidase [Polyangium mundeleinium]|uniref:Beta-galactosidase n=1 Tax=Polyangium mundeleinium TaxID=2995306 RepID=A0ABT5EF47_9BACT|nr:beta-galactosidase [Polyangium mundeleinium]MDC0740079.1 beta-galactosidase [Polyangium mundeleinium]
MTAREDRAGGEGLGRRVRLVPGGIEIAGDVVPLLAGSVHYWRLDPNEWRACLEAVKAMGLRLVDTYIPWAVHEVAPGKLELGASDPQRDITRFCRIAEELGLYVIARPGPHINAELTYFGLPERIVWDPACQARSPDQNPVMLPMLPFAFPVPSYASDAFHDEAARYFQALGPALTPLLYPNGPIVLFQIDNEGALYFRDGAYDQDYHPDAIRLYREFLREKYGTIDALRASYGTPTLDEGEVPSSRRGEVTRFSAIDPPRKFDAERPRDLARHLDWSEFHEHLLTTAFQRLGRALAAAGMDGLPTTHNLPPGQDATPLNAARVTKVVDLVGLDYYHMADPTSRAIIARRTSELATRCEALSVPAFACEMGAGFPPFFPPLDERDGAFTVLCALAYGLRGFNVYMAVERDRWIGAPIDRHGRARPYAVFWRKLCAALEQTNFHELRRRAPVRLLLPRTERRLARVMHAFGPLSGAFFSIVGAGARERCVEDDLGLGYPLAIEADNFARAFEQALEARGVPFAVVGGEDRDIALGDARWLICATSGALKPELFDRLAEAHARGARVTIGPHEPRFDGAFRPLSVPFDLRRLGEDGPLTGDVPAAADAAVSHAIGTLGLPAYACDPGGIYVTVHEDAAGAPRVLFVVNPSERDIVARVSAGAVRTKASDLIDDSTFEARAGTLEVRMKPRTVRMLALR